MFRLSPLALAGALIATGVTIVATSPAQAAIRKVYFGDLDLTTVAGRASADHRLGVAASAVCLEENRDLSLAAACRRKALSMARTDLRLATQGNAVQLASR